MTGLGTPEQLDLWQVRVLRGALDQLNFDGDDAGDACDADVDGDSVANAAD